MTDMDVVLFHSMYGLRPVEIAAAGRLQAAGHRVTVPDLFAGQRAPGEPDAGFALMARIGWSRIVGSAREAVAQVPGEAALIGFSMGVGVIGQLWPDRLDAAAVACLHAPTSVPQGVRPGTPVQLHVAATDDRFAPVEQVAEFRRSADRAGAAALVRSYPHAGHFFSDDSLGDYDAAAAAATWEDVLRMLDPST